MNTMNMHTAPAHAASAAPLGTGPVFSWRRAASTYGLPLVLLAALGGMGWLDAWSVTLLGKIFAIWIAVLGLQLLINHAGMLSLGHAAFVAIGAYSAGGLALGGPHTLWAMLAAVALACAAAGALIGAAVLRTQGLYQLMATLAFAQMVWYGLQSLRSLGGDDGFALPHRPALLWWADGADGSAGWALDANPALGVVVVILAGLCAALVAWLHRSELGAAMQAGRDDPQRLASLGINVFAVKLLAFVVSAVLAGTGGAMLAHLSGFASPQLGHWLFSGELMVLVLLGGHSRLGALLACAALVLAQEMLAQVTDHWPLALGLLVLLRVLWPTSFWSAKRAQKQGAQP